MNWALIILVFLLSLGCLIGVVVIFDVRAYMDLQRRLREERERKAEK